MPLVEHVGQDGKRETALAIFDPNNNSITQSLFIGEQRGAFYAGDEFVDEGALTADEAFGRITVHELGHALMHGSDEPTREGIRASWARAVRLGACVSVRAQRNPAEYFAESFEAFMFEPEELKSSDPKAFEMIRRILRARGIDHDTTHPVLSDSSGA